MQSDILFDNIYIGHSVEDAEKLKTETYDVKAAIEKAEEDAAKPKPKPTPESPMDIKFMDDPVHYIREKVDLFWALAQKDPVTAIKTLPEVAGGIGALAVTIIALLIGVVSMTGGSPPPQVKKAAEKVVQSAMDTKDKVVDAASTGAEKAQAELNKRTTRSSGPAE
jgi:calnexin